MVEVVEELLVVVELHVPLARLRVPKVVAERHQKSGRTKETRLLAVLIQQEERPEEADRRRWVHSTGALAPYTAGPALAYLSRTFSSVIGCGAILHGQLGSLPGRRWKSNWQQTDGLGPHVCGTS